MDLKQGSLYTILVLGGIGLLAVSCSDPDNNGGHHSDKMEHGKTTEHHGAADSHVPAKSGDKMGLVNAPGRTFLYDAV